MVISREAFRRRYKELVPDFEDLWESLNRPQRKTVRLNRLKADRSEILKLMADLILEPLPWYRDGFVVSGRGGLGTRLEHFLGYIYVQEAASMVPVLVLDPQPGEKVLDLAAAPGSKTTQIAQSMDNRGLIVSNDISRRRRGALRSNLDRAGVLNAVITAMNGKYFGNRLPSFFDRVLLDAPCSSECIARGSRISLFSWSEKMSKRLSREQKGLIVSAFRALKPEGLLVYSTCTFAPEENEGVVDYLLTKFREADIERIDIPYLKTRPGLQSWHGALFDKRVVKSVRIYPQDNDTDGFFIAKIVKRG